MALQHLRSGTAHKRPIPAAMSAGQIAINTNEASPGLFFKNSNGDLVKVGPVHIGTTAPNSSPASTAATALVSGTIYQILTVGTTDFTTVGASANTVGTVFTATGAGTGDGTVSGQQGVEKGEQWLDTTGGNYVLKIYDGTAWRSESGTFVDSSGDTMTGALLLDNAASASAPDLSFDGDPDTGVYSPGANKLALVSGGSERLRIQDTGYLGINQSNPRSLLHIKAATPIFTIEDSSGATAGIESTCFLRDNNSFQFQTRSSTNSYVDSLYYVQLDASGATHHHWRIANSEKMRLTGTGLGIGQTSPDGRLHVRTDGAANGSVASRSGIVLQANNISSGAANSRIQWTYSGLSSSTKAYIEGGVYGSDYLAFGRGDGTGEAMRITNDGKVGIGATGVTELLQLQAASNPKIRFVDEGNYEYKLGITSNNKFSLLRSGSNTETVTVTSGGSVGIGTANPAQRLHVHNPGTGAYSTLRVSNGDGVEVDLFAASGSDAGLVSKISGDALYFGTNNTERMRIAANGNVGIGTTAPAYNFEVQGKIHVNKVVTSATGDFTRVNASSIFRGKGGRSVLIGTEYNNDNPYIQSGFADADAVNTGKLLLNPAGGSVGIGTSNPGNLLSIAGSEPRIEVKDTDTNARFLIDCNSTAGSVNFRVDQDNSSANSAAIFNIDASEKMRLTSNGRLGIGTSSPATPFAVSASGAQGFEVFPELSGSTTVTTYNRSTNAYYPLNFRSQFIKFSPGGVEKVRITGIGRMGLGTSDPKSDLHIKSGTPILTIEDASGASTGIESSCWLRDNNSFQLQTRSSGNAYKDTPMSISLGTSGATSHQWRVTNTERMRLTATGLGIGTASPSQKLHVQGTSLLKGEVVVAATGTNGEGGQITFKNPNGTDTGGTIDISSANTHRIFSVANNYTLQMGQLGGTGGKILFHTSASERMQITSGGNVGIGTSNPNAKLDVASYGAGYPAAIELTNTTGNGNSIRSKRGLVLEADYDNNSGNTESDVIFKTDSTQRMVVRYDGRIGIGVASPAYKLHVEDSSSPVLGIRQPTGGEIRLHAATDLNGHMIRFGGDGNNGTVETRTLRFVTAGNAERMRISNTGNLGIGTSSPTALLHINKSNNNFIKLSTGTSATNTEQGILNYGRLVSGVTPTFPGQLTSYIKEIRNGSSSQFSLHFGTTDSNTADATNKMIVRYDGNVGIGTIYPQGKLHIETASGAGWQIRTDTANLNNESGFYRDGSNNYECVIRNSQGGLSFLKNSGTSANPHLLFHVGTTEKARITTTDLLVGKSARNFATPGTQTEGNAGQGWTITNGATSGVQHCLGLRRNTTLTTTQGVAFFYRNASAVGNISITTNSTNFNTTSDYRLKENVVELSGAIARVNQLQPKRFNFISEPGKTVDGFLAHEAQTVVPEAVTGTHNEVDDEGNPVMQGIDQAKLVPLLTAALQEALAKIATLETKVAALEAGS